MTFYSQVGQDKFVCEYFNYKRGGYFLDIGAFDGVGFSNTYYLEKELGWTGICVEAGETIFSLLKEHRECICLNKAVSDRNKIVWFNENWTVGHIADFGKETASITMKRLFIDYKVPKLIDYISLDIEGSEYSALTKFPFSTHEVILWTIEHNSHLDNGVMKDKILALMEKNGYICYEGTMKPEAAGFENWFINKRYDNNQPTR